MSPFPMLEAYDWLKCFDDISEYLPQNHATSHLFFGMYFFLSLQTKAKGDTAASLKKLASN
jgi:hypothetical protein